MSQHHFSSRYGDLTQGRISSHLIRLSVPMMWGIFALISFQLVATFYISRLGTEALAAFSFTFPVTYVIFSVYLGFSIAMASITSRLIGEKKDEEAKRTTMHGIALVFITSVLMASIGFLTLEPLFKSMGATDAQYEQIKDFMHIYLLGTFFISMPIVGNAALRARGDSLSPALIMTLAALFNAIIDPILIFGLFGFPRLELQGAAISIVISNIGACIAGFIMLKKRRLLCLKSLFDVSDLGPSAQKFLMIAVPAGIASSLPGIVNSVVTSILAKSGAADVAAFGVVSRIEAFCFIVMMGLASGMAPILGQNLGAKKFERVQETLRKALRFCVLWSISVAVILILGAPFLAHIFSKDLDVQKIIILYFYTIPISYAFSNIFSGWASAFNAFGQARLSASATFLKLIVVMIPACWIGHAMGGTLGVFTAMGLVHVSSGVLFHFYSRAQLHKMIANASSH
jgi:putative MATE family efflux protein